NVMPAGNGRRVAVVAGCRTPFCRSGTALKDVRAVDLARFVARELLERTELAGAEVDAVIFGHVVPSALGANVAREVSLLPQFPKEIPAYSLNRACASSGQAVANAYDEIDRKSTRLNSSHRTISYAVFCLKKKKSKFER